MKPTVKDANGNCIVCGTPWRARPSSAHIWRYLTWLFQHIHTTTEWIAARKRPA